MPTSLAAMCARTTPASVLRSVRAIADRPSSAARSTSSSGCEPPRRNEKLLVICSSAPASVIGRQCTSARTICACPHERRDDRSGRSGQELDQRDDRRGLGDYDAGEPLDQADLDIADLLLELLLQLRERASRRSSSSRRSAFDASVS
jgi:hypothetical protein